MSKREKIMLIFNTLREEHNEVDALHDQLKVQQRYVDWLYKYGKSDDYDLSVDCYNELQDELLSRVNRLNLFREFIGN